MPTMNAGTALPPSSPLKRWLDRNIPFVYRPVRTAREQYRGRRFRRQYDRLTHEITHRHGWVVQSGPFRGMKYVREACSSALLPKLLGTYELEVQHVIERVIQRADPLVVDIGAAEGYYAVGMALRLPESRVIAYEENARARALCQELADLNGVTNVEIRGSFLPRDAASFDRQSAFVICDVDGYEVELFDREHAGCWANSELLIELHDCLGPPCRETVLRAIEETHTAEVIPTRPRTLDDCPLPDDLPSADRLLAMNEIRPSQEWVHVTCKAEAQ